VIVTGDDFCIDAFAADSVAGAFAAVVSAATVMVGATPAADAFDAAGFFDWASISAAATFCGCRSSVAMSSGSDGRATAINIAAPVTQSTARRIVHAPIARLTRVGFFERTDFFKRIFCFMRIDVLLRGTFGTSNVESKWGAQARLAMAGCNAP